MKDSQDAMERVLAGLRDAEASEGMERRILDAVQNAAAGSRRGWRRLIPSGLAATPEVFAKSVAYAIAVTSVLFLLIPATHLRRRTSVPSIKNFAPVTAMTEVPSEATVSVSKVRVKERPRTQRVKLVLSQESLALREMHAPSRPEPPMPLTEQEKLLVRFVQTRNTEELASINPMKWAAQDAKQRAEFEKFFEPPTNRRYE